MLRRPFVPFLFIAALSLAAGCVSQQTRKVVDLTPFKRIYVVQRLGDDHHLNEIFVAELQRLGHDATTGPRTMLPDNADATLAYTDRWEWDFKNYLIELNIELHTAHTKKKLADGRYFQPTPKPKPPADVVRELLAPLFAK
ncbi:MAG: hypothetical protein HZA93_00605 [Verrucomicrobia bacterium]|nr:hypothetical protein [Verrucomicrobiota bacterium]